MFLTPNHLEKYLANAHRIYAEGCSNRLCPSALPWIHFSGYFKTLNVSYDASEPEIRTAYRALARQWHPDKAARHGVAIEDATKIMRVIRIAYEELKAELWRSRSFFEKVAVGRLSLQLRDMFELCRQQQGAISNISRVQRGLNSEYDSYEERRRLY